MNSFRIMAFTRLTLESFSKALGSDLDFLPSVEIITEGETDYCGKMKLFGNDVMEYATIVLDPVNIIDLSEIDNISFEQALTETIYHEWIHFVHGLCHFDDYDLLMTHEGELWDIMISLGIHSGFITRRDI